MKSPKRVRAVLLKRYYQEDNRPRKALGASTAGIACLSSVRWGSAETRKCSVAARERATR
jgi:hypothetical protein